MDEPGVGGACHHYRITYLRGPSALFAKWHCKFQEGPVGREGINGVTDEVLLAIVRDRLERLQSGAFACDENASAMQCVEQAMQWLRILAENRLAHGVGDAHDADGTGIGERVPPSEKPFKWLAAHSHDPTEVSRTG
jgi:hypothetical protein